MGGRSAWLHVWVGERATAYAIDSQRSAAALERVIGLDWDGILSHDGYATYERFEEATHQQCLAHVLRRAQGLLERAKGMAVRFPQHVIALLRQAIHWRNRYLLGEVTREALENQRERFDERLWELIRRPRGVPDHERLAQHLSNHGGQWFPFLTDPSIEPTNWLAEQAIRPAVVNRKVWGGNRTPAGSKAQGVLMSVLETCRRQAHSVIDYVSQTLRCAGNLLLPRPILLPAR